MISTRSGLLITGQKLIPIESLMIEHGRNYSDDFQLQPSLRISVMVAWRKVIWLMNPEDARIVMDTTPAQIKPNAAGRTETQRRQDLVILIGVIWV